MIKHPEIKTMENLIKVLLPGNVESLERATEEPMMQIGAKRMFAAQAAQTTNHLPEKDRLTLFKPF